MFLSIVYFSPFWSSFPLYFDTEKRCYTVTVVVVVVVVVVGGEGRGGAIRRCCRWYRTETTAPAT